MTTSQNLQSAATRVSAALRKLSTAASSHLGSDCYMHAQLGRVLLADLGVQASLAVGFAAWRIGDGDGAVISHTPYAQVYLPADEKGFAYHAWLDYAGFVVDFTTYQLAYKARKLDAMDGRHTTVAWCPEFLLLPKRSIRSYIEVVNAPHAGVAYYETRPELGLLLQAQSSMDSQDLLAARLLLANPGMTVIGPNDI